jgi:hypothetical protein
MGKLLELNHKIDQLIEQKGLDKKLTRGKIGLKSGVLLAFNENTPDDPEKIKRIQAAVKEILGQGI